MDTIDIDCQGGNAWTMVPRFMRGEIHDREGVARLFYVDSGGHEVASLDLDFTAASELMIWLNTNIHRLMRHPDDSTRVAEIRALASIPAPPADPPVNPMFLRVECHECSNDAVYQTWDTYGDDNARPSCVHHTRTNYRMIPDITAVQLACLWLVSATPGLSTQDYANRGAPSWTVRGTGNALYQLARRSLVSRDRTVPSAPWIPTPWGCIVAAQLRPARQD